MIITFINGDILEMGYLDKSKEHLHFYKDNNIYYINKEIIESVFLDDKSVSMNDLIIMRDESLDITSFNKIFINEIIDLNNIKGIQINENKILKRVHQAKQLATNQKKSDVNYNKNYIFMGFIANIPNQLIGFNLFALNHNKIRGYIDLKTSIGINEDNYYESISINEVENVFGDDLLKKKEVNTSFNIGITQRIIKQLYILTGTGYVANKKYREYYDPYHILGENGNYWISGNSSGSLSFFIGIITIIEDKYSFQFGYNLKPSGINIGFAFAFNNLFKY